MTHNVQSPPVSAVMFSAAFNLLKRGGVKFLKGTHSAVLSLQTARMMATLSNMSDQQLAQIGITRSGIPDYANKLIAPE